MKFRKEKIEIDGKAIDLQQKMCSAGRFTFQKASELKALLKVNELK